jgi:putative (di)nucleoside polyphosphate hydrolase
MIDRHGFRLNVGIILSNQEGRLFWGRRTGQQNAWQFPQGGIQDYETLEEAMYRELNEELGLIRDDVKIMGMTRQWLYYRLPKYLRRHYSKPMCIGQKQKWFLLQLTGDEERIRFDLTDSPEFDTWCWVDYWDPLVQVIEFKRGVYKKALSEFAPLLNNLCSNFS